MKWVICYHSRRQAEDAGSPHHNLHNPAHEELLSVGVSHNRELCKNTSLNVCSNVC